MFFSDSYGAQIGSVKTTSVNNPSLPARREQSNSHSIGSLNVAQNTFYNSIGSLNIARNTFILIQNTFYSSIGSLNVAQNTFYSSIGSFNVAQNTFYSSIGSLNIAQNTIYSSLSTFNSLKIYLNSLKELLIAFPSDLYRVIFFSNTIKHTPDLSLDYPRSSVKLTGYPFPKPDFMYSK